MPPEQGIKLRKINITNYKCIDSLELEFPAPLMAHDPDVVVLGSRNGLGKTSVLECCALLLLAVTYGEENTGRILNTDDFLGWTEVMIRSGKTDASIRGEFTVGGTAKRATLVLDASREVSLTTEIRHDRGARNDSIPGSHEMDRLRTRFFGVSPNPLVLGPFTYFHSYRKVSEKNTDLGTFAEHGGVYIERIFRSYFFEDSEFKRHVISSMMAKAGLFEHMDDRNAEKGVDTLNQLVERYAGGSIAKLRPKADNTVDFRVTTDSGSFPFDGLSSGQKEIISTLYLIWRNTLDQPGIVLIDEPELHLNAEWQADFLDQLHKLAPANQYIIATHSELVFGSVQASHRVILELPGGSPE